MKRTISTILMYCFIISLMISAISGCTRKIQNGQTEDTSKKIAACFVIGATGNSLGLNYSSSIVRETTYNLIRNYGYIAVVNADGNPEVVHASSYDVDERFKGAQGPKLDMEANKKSKALIANMESLTANDMEVDYLKSLQLAVSSLASLEGYDAKKIIVLGTGLNTVGELDFTKNLLYADPGVIVEKLKEKKEIPDLTDINTVEWQQLGCVASPQKELNGKQKDKLEKIYMGIIEAGGSHVNFNEVISNPVDNTKDFPTVTPIDLPSDEPIAFDPKDFDISYDTAFDKPVFLTEEKVTFIADKAEYLHLEDAKDTLKPIAECLISHPQLTILLAGTTAGDVDESHTLHLSLERAEAVKNTLVKFGADGSRIITIGLGSTRNPWHVYGLGTGSAGSVNRAVVVMNAEGETAMSILRQHNP